ncbi:hypothetical protein Lser_V15G44386 [Lactuca serriola]
MAPSNSTIMFLSYCFLLVLIVAGKRSATEGSEAKVDAITHHYQTVKLSSFLSSSICSPSTKRDKKYGSLKVVHKHGPCSKFSKNIMKPITMEEILTHDQSRFDAIRSRLTTTTTTGKKDIKTSMATMPATSGTLFNSGNYIVTIGMGTPKKDLSLIMDTGSDLTWTQCQPCSGSCYSQQDPMFSPSLSTTYSNISCTSTECSLLPSATGNLPGCRSLTCVYGIRYGDGSYSVGEFAKEKLTLSQNEEFENFMFGCGQTNDGDYGTATGLLGLGSGKLSIVSQTANKYGKVFSYCLPSTDSSSGYLTFGKSGISRNVKYTPLLTSLGGSTFFNVKLVSMTIGNTRIAMKSSMIMDSGTVITRLPPKAYLALRNTFRAEMTQYPLTKPLSILDTCYDLSNHTDVRMPTISMGFGQNVNVGIQPQGALIATSRDKMCLAFTGNDDDSEPSIYGNIQQMTTQIVYDMAEGKVGFSPQGCE